MKWLFLSLSLWPAFAPAAPNCYPDRRMATFFALVPTERVSESERDQIFGELRAIYGQEVAAEGGTLRLFETANMGFGAWASREVTGGYLVEVYQGVRYHRLMTSDAFALVLCHELGHHLARIPRKPYSSWASAEGQADYFANLKCFRRYLERVAPAVQGAPPELLSRCAASFIQPQDVSDCARGLTAARALGAVLADLEGLVAGEYPQLETPDRTVVTETNVEHPAAQCRLDTYRAGSLCPVGWADGLSVTDARKGVCHSQNLPEHGRPACWFAE